MVLFLMTLWATHKIGSVSKFILLRNRKKKRVFTQPLDRTENTKLLKVYEINML